MAIQAAQSPQLQHYWSHGMQSHNGAVTQQNAPTVAQWLQNCLTDATYTCAPDDSN